MSKLNEIFVRQQEIRREKRIIQDTYKDALSNSRAYQQALETFKEAQTKKKQIELEIQQDFSSEFNKLDRLKQEYKDTQDMMSDVALTMYAKGQEVEIVDEYDTVYEPEFKVAFKKAASQNK